MSCLLSLIPAGSGVCHIPVFPVHLSSSVCVLSPLVGCDLPLPAPLPPGGHAGLPGPGPRRAALAGATVWSVAAPAVKKAAGPRSEPPPDEDTPLPSHGHDGGGARSAKRGTAAPERCCRPAFECPWEPLPGLVPARCSGAAWRSTGCMARRWQRRVKDEVAAAVR